MTAPLKIENILFHSICTASQLARLDELCFKTSWSEKDYQVMLLQPSFASWMLEVVDAELVGFLVCQSILPEIEILRIGILPEWRRRGLAGLMLEMLEKHSQQIKMETFWLEVHEANLAAIKTYLNFGFLESGRRKKYYRDPLGDALIFNKTIPANLKEVILKETAIILTNGSLNSRNAKTAYGLIRNSEHYQILAIIDQNNAGQDAGQIVNGKDNGIPVLASINDFLLHQSKQKGIASAECGKGVFMIIGIATAGGVIPDDLRPVLIEGLCNGMNVVNGLHHYLSDDAEIVETASKNNSQLLDIRKPKSAKDHEFWTGDILNVRAPRIAVLGMDCALGKRTTCLWLRDACRESGISTEMIYTGQTGKLQGGKYGFILDSTLNDFVSGELEAAVIRCDNEAKPDLILLEGQSSLRNPSGPCGSEYLCSAQAKGVILQYEPNQKFYLTDDESSQWPLPPIEEEIELIRLYGSEVLAVTLNGLKTTTEQLKEDQLRLQKQLGLPVVCPKEDGVGRLIPVVQEFLNRFR